jgi:AcrR family transcriptional regulator
MNKRPEITEQTRNNLREAFWTLYMNAPVSRITVKQITDLAGYNRATFYHYYSDVPKLLEEEENKLLDEISELLETASHGALNEQIGPLLEVLVKNNRYASALLSDHGDPAFVSRLKEMIWPYVRSFLVQVTPGDPYEGALMKEFYLSAIFGTVRLWLQDPRIDISRLIGLLVAEIARRPQEETLI